MRVRALTAVAVLIAIGLGTANAQAASKFEGTVVAKNKSARTFKLRQDQGGGTFKFKVNRTTRYQRIAGFKAIKRGQKNIEVTARKRKGRWIATKVERSGKSGGGGRGGADDPPGHT